MLQLTNRFSSYIIEKTQSDLFKALKYNNLDKSKGEFMNSNNQLVTIWMFTGMLAGLAIGCFAGISQGKLGTFMCLGLVLGMIVGIVIGTAVKNLKTKK